LPERDSDALVICGRQFSTPSPRISGLRRDARLARQAMSSALNGTKHRNGKVKTPGLCALFGLAIYAA
jgi:hypothetical protein